MDNKEKEKVEEELRKYLLEIDKDPNSGPNAYSADDLALGAMFRVHPGRLSQINKQARDRVKEYEMYSVFREGVVDIAREEGWNAIVALEENKDIVRGYVPGNYEQKVQEKINPDSALRQTGGLGLNDYQKAADAIVEAWKSFIQYKNSKKKGK